MTRNFENRGSRQTGMAYFVRRSRDGCAVIELHRDNREAIIASGLVFFSGCRKSVRGQNRGDAGSRCAAVV
jgi:hypothetical protein